MAEPVDAFFLSHLAKLADRPIGDSVGYSPHRDFALALFEAQIQSRHLDLAARWLQSQGQGFYTIGSAGHEANAALGLLTRVDDPALLHYRSGGFYAARARRHAELDPTCVASPIRDVLLSMVTAASDPMSGGRHKVFGHPALNIIPQTSTISSHLPRSVGLALAIGAMHDLLPAQPWPSDAIVISSAGDASINHSTAQGALNAAAYLAHRGIPTPLLFVCEDNGIGISTKSPLGWTSRTLERLPGVAYFPAQSADPSLLCASVELAIHSVRATRKPAVLHLSTVRFMGHAGSDAEIGYRSRAEIEGDFHRDPILAAAAYLVSHGILSVSEVRERYEQMRLAVMSEARAVLGERRLESREEVLRALVGPQKRNDRQLNVSDPDERSAVWGGRLPESLGPLTLAQTINAALTDYMHTRRHAVVFGEDVAVKGGIYGVTRGLRKRFGGQRVFDTLLDEQTILGIALGTSVAGLLPIPEIQYLAYLHNAEDQLRGEAASLGFFSNGQYRNPMVIRVAGLAYQKGFGGHFHNDNSVAVLRDIPGVILCVPSHPREAAGLLLECLRLAEEESRVCVYLEPIALYHSKDLHETGDSLWTGMYEPSETVSREPNALGTVRVYDGGENVLVLTFGNGVPMSLRAARRVRDSGISVSVLDLRWLSPLPVEEVVSHVRRFRRVLIVDETRQSGGVSEAIAGLLLDAGFDGVAGRVTSADSFVPLGPSTQHVLLGEAEIERAIRALMNQLDEE